MDVSPIIIILGAIVLCLAVLLQQDKSIAMSMAAPSSIEVIAYSPWEQNPVSASSLLPFTQSVKGDIPCSFVAPSPSTALRLSRSSPAVTPNFRTKSLAAPSKSP